MTIADEMTQLEFARALLCVSADIAKWMRTQILTDFGRLSEIVAPDIGREYLRQIRVMLDQIEGRL